MQKIKGIVCYSVGILLSVLTFAWYACAGFVMKMKEFGFTAKTDRSVWWCIKHIKDLDGLWKTSTVFAIVALVVACLLVVSCTLGLLHELGVVKLSWIKYVNYAVVGLLFVLTLIAMATMAAYGSKNSGEGLTMTAGAGLVLPFVFSVVQAAAVVVATLNFGKKAE